MYYEFYIRDAIFFAQYVVINIVGIYLSIKIHTTIIYKITFWTSLFLIRGVHTASSF